MEMLPCKTSIVSMCLGSLLELIETNVWLRSSGWNYFFPANESIIGKFDEETSDDGPHPLSVETEAGRLPPYAGPEDAGIDHGEWRRALGARAGHYTNPAIARDAWNWRSWDRRRSTNPFDVEGRPGDGLRIFTSAIRFSTPTWLPSAMYAMDTATWASIVNVPLQTVFERLEIGTVGTADFSVRFPARKCHPMLSSSAADAISVISTCLSPNSSHRVWCLRRCIQSHVDITSHRATQASISSVVLSEKVAHQLISPLPQNSFLSIVQPGLQEFQLEFARGAPEQWLAFSESERVRMVLTIRRNQQYILDLD